MSSRSTLVHDLRGPLVTIEGFTGEIGQALGELETMLGAQAAPEEVVGRLTELLDEDLLPCLEFVSRAVTMMHGRIDGIDGAASDGDDG